jgi:serine carboxypeptidase-like clade I
VIPLDRYVYEAWLAEVPGRCAAKHQYPISSQSGDGNSCGIWNDELTAHHNRIYLESFFQRYPKYKSHDFYITGESYAGVYVPTLVREILDNSNRFYLNEDEKQPSWSLKNQLRGFAVGDGCMGTKNVCGPNGPGPLLNLEFMRGHGQFSDKLYYQTFEQCTKAELVGFHDDAHDNDSTDRGLVNGTCLAHLKKIEAAVGPVFAYGIYDSCWYQNDMEPPHNTLTQKRRYFSRLPRKPQPSQASSEARRLRESIVSTSGQFQGALNDYPCGGNEAFFTWVQTPQVKAALHVDPNAYFFSGDNGVGFTYVPSEPDLVPFYLRAVKETNLRVLVYNGDTDPAINR